MDTEKLLNDINKGLQALAREDLSFPVAEELPPLDRGAPIPWAQEQIQPPGALYISPRTALTLYMQSTVANVTCSFTVVLLHRDGHTSYNDYRVNNGVAGSAGVRTLAIPEGFLLAIFVNEFTGLTKYGQTWALVWLGDGTPTPQITTHVLVRAPVTGLVFGSWPNGKLVNPSEVEAYPIQKTVTPPAAGAEWTQTVPANFLWEVIAIQYELFTSAAAANRRATVVEVLSGGPQFDIIVPMTVQTASLGYRYVADPSKQNAFDALTIVTAPLTPRLLLPGGTVIMSATSGLQIGDQFNNIYLLVREKSDLA